MKMLLAADESSRHPWRSRQRPTGHRTAQSTPTAALSFGFASSTRGHAVARHECACPPANTAGQPTTVNLGSSISAQAACFRSSPSSSSPPRALRSSDTPRTTAGPAILRTVAAVACQTVGCRQGHDQRFRTAHRARDASHETDCLICSSREPSGLSLATSAESECYRRCRTARVIPTTALGWRAGRRANPTSAYRRIPGCVLKGEW